MKKVTLLMSADHKNQALEKLRQVGVLHIHNVNQPVDESISSLQSDVSAAESALKALEEHREEVNQKTKDNPHEIVKEFHKLETKKERLEDEIVEILDEYNWYQKWGKINIDDLDYLADKGLYVKLYEADKSVKKKLPEDKIVFVVDETKSGLLLAMISDDKDARLLDLKPESLPENPFDEVEREVDVYKKQIGSVKKEIRQMADFYDLIELYKNDLEQKLEFQLVKHGMGSAEVISYLQGYCPEEKIDDLKQTAETANWGYMIDEPKETDNPPTLLKNEKWVRMIQPVFDFLGTVPGYREYDISKYFLVFFAVFFAMIIGDAGYGVLFLVGAIFARTKVNKSQKTPEALKLLFLLSITTITWGTITGNWFGSAVVSGFPPMKALTIPQIATFPELFPGQEIDAQSKIMFICFVLALVQLGLANIMNFMNEFPSLKSYSHLGWLSLMGGLFFLVLNLVLGQDMPQGGIAQILIYGGLGGIIVFGAQEKGKSFVKGLLGGLGGAFNTFLDSISSFSNIISYIRLFAVGMASVAIASSFNEIAAPMLKGFALPAGILVLLIGHGLNIVMGMLSVIVHGIRLNVLEFSGQLGIEWSGYKYKPFKDKK
ncbi:MAG: V-type ATPase 116kDa subunit family protein [Fidelibacterota bacterium]